MNEQLMQSLLSSSPRLLPGCRVTITIIRNEHWVILKNPASGDLVRLHRDLWSVVTLFDGKTHVEQWMNEHAARFGEQRLLAALLTLQRAGIVQTGVELTEPDLGFGQRLMRYNPLMIRVALFNPARFLDRLCASTARLSSRTVLCVFVLLLVAAMYAMVMHWQDIVEQWRTLIGSPQMWYYFLLYPLAKSLHELAHGWTLRRFGADVPEAGICFLILFPMPYVDASDGWTLTRHERMWVSAAGMLMDAVLACTGLLLWTQLSAGVLADMAFTFFLMGVASVVFFNANPLLKFDGYYLLEDALDSPGLAQRAGIFYRYLSKRYILNLPASRPPVMANGETPWLLLYGAASTVYRFFIAIVICAFLVSTFFELGVLLSLFCLIPLLLLPVHRLVSFLFYSRELDRCRARALVTIMGVFAVLAILIFIVPLPSSTRTQGVVWVNEQAEVYASQAGQIKALLVANGDRVQPGQALLELESDTLSLQLEQQRSAVRLAELEVIRYRQSKPALARSSTITLQQSRGELAQTHQKLEKLTVLAPFSGTVVMGDADVLQGALVSQGELLFYIVNEQQRVVRAVVAQSAMGQVEQGINKASVRLPQAMQQRLPVTVSRQLPSANHELPSAALMNTGFGGFDVETQQGDAPLRTREKVFHLELTLKHQPEALRSVPMGTRAFVTLEHDSEPIGQRLFRLSRQLLLNLKYS